MDFRNIAGPVLVTGATGFIGRALISRLLGEGVRVRAFVLPDEAVEGLLPAEVEVARGDIANAASVAAAMEGAGTVIHLAAVVGDWGPEELFERVTVGGTRNTLSAAADRNVRAVLASSVVTYGASIPVAVCSEDLPHGQALGPYSRSKQAQERVAWALASERGLRVTIVRPTNVYGPGSRPWVDRVAAQLRQGLPALIGGGHGNAGLAHVDNVVDILVRAAACDAAIGRTYNACDGSDVTWRQYFTDMAAIVGVPVPGSMPLWLARIGAAVAEPVWRTFSLRGQPPLTREALNLVGSHHRVPIDRARRELGYEPVVDYQTGMRGVAVYLGRA